MKSTANQIGPRKLVTPSDRLNDVMYDLKCARKKLEAFGRLLKPSSSRTAAVAEVQRLERKADWLRGLIGRKA